MGCVIINIGREAELKRVTKKLVKPFFLFVKWVIVMLWLLLLTEIFEVFPLI